MGEGLAVGHVIARLVGIAFGALPFPLDAGDRGLGICQRGDLAAGRIWDLVMEIRDFGDDDIRRARNDLRLDCVEAGGDRVVERSDRCGLAGECQTDRPELGFFDLHEHRQLQR